MLQPEPPGVLTSRYFMMEGVVARRSSRKKMGMRLIGCDICQRASAACELNLKREKDARTETLRSGNGGSVALFPPPTELSGEIRKNAARPQRFNAERAFAASGDAKYLPARKLANHPLEAVAEHGAGREGKNFRRQGQPNKI